MKIIKNEQLITRNARIGRYLSLVGLVTIVGVTIYLFQAMSQSERMTDTSTWVLLGVLLVGMIISQVSVYFAVRWGRRPDLLLEKALKGLPGDYTLYHYTTPVPHLLVGPAGVWLLLPYFVRGVVTYQKNRWRLSGGSLASKYMRFLGQETLGRPDLEANAQADALARLLKKHFAEGEELPSIQAALVFLEEETDIQADEAPLPTLPAKKLKDFLRKAAKEKPLPAAQIARLNSILAGTSS